MESGEAAEQGNGRLDVPTARQAKRAGPNLEAGPEASAERSEGTMEARHGARLAQRGSMRSTTARPAMLLGRGRPDFKAERTTDAIQAQVGGSSRILEKNS